MAEPGRGALVRGLVAAIAVILVLSAGRNAVALDTAGSDGARHPEIEAAAQKAIAASKQFLARTKDVYKTGQAPRETDPAIGPLLHDIFDVGPLQTTEVSPDDGSAVAEWLLASVHVGTIYLGAGTGFARLADIARDPKAREASDRNVVDYAPEVGRYLDADVVLETALLGSTFADGSPPDDPMLRKVYDKMRLSFEMSISSFLKSLAIPGLAYDWRLARLAVLEANAPKIARLLDADKCGRLHETVALVSARIHDSRVTDKLADFDRRLVCAKG